MVIGAAGGIRIPIQQIEGEWVAPHEVIIDHEGPYQVIGAQHVEGRRHVAAVEVAVAVHLALKIGQLLFVDEDLQIPRLAEIDQRGEEVADAMRSSPRAAMWARVVASKVPPMQ